MKKLAVIILILFLMPIALADGMIIDPHGPVMERGQQAAITYEKTSNGYLQKMIISVSSDPLHKDTKAAWIFPVPSNPDDVVIDVVTQFPRMYGYELISQAEKDVKEIIEFTRISLILPIFKYFVRGTVAMQKAAAPTVEGVWIDIGQEVIVYEEIEKEGVTVQTLGAKEGSSLWIFLQRQGLEVPMKSIKFFDYYIDKDYTFVVAFLTPEKENSEEIAEKIMPSSQEIGRYPYRNIGVEVMFHTDKIFYPLLPTSIYGSEKIPATIWVIGDFVKPKLYEAINSFVETKYYKSTSVPYSQLEEFFGDLKQKTDVKYTVISLNNAPSKYLTEDMWIEKGTPANVQYAEWLTSFTYRNTGWAGFFMLAIISAIAGTIMGVVLFQDKWWKLTLTSLANCLSIIGLIIALVFVKTEDIDKDLKRRMKEAGILTISRDFKRKLIFLVGFIVWFLLIGWFVQWLLISPL